MTRAASSTIVAGQSARMSLQQWSAALERRALLAGMPAVIDGVDCQPSSPQAYEALMRLYAPRFREVTA
jgi:hypothetical protein